MSRPRPIDEDQNRIDDEASTWVVLAAERALTDREQAELDQWLAADPRHANAWAAFSRTWSDIPAVQGLADLAPLTEPLASVAGPRLQTRWKKAYVTGFAALAASVLVFFAVPSLQRGGEQYATEIAQTRLLALPDGTQVTLGPHSRLAVKFSKGERRVALTGGEAFFEVVHDSARPFFVEAGTSSIRVVGTKFDVNYGSGTVRVAVLEGVVQVSQPAAAVGGQPVERLLRAGERSEIAQRPLPRAGRAPDALAVLPAQAPGAWREGRLVYENARLADLVADVNRYYAPGVAVSDSEIGEMRITAAFKVSEIPAFMNALGGVVPVDTEEAANGAFQLQLRN